MGFDMNSGYSGWSMSRNAVAAYHDGEMPKSKWTKKAILAALEDYCDEYDLVFVEPKGTKAELFERFVEYKSWHHTSKFCNCTDFYGLNEEEIEESFEPMDEEQVAARDAARAAERAREEAERAERIARRAAKLRAEAAWREERGYERGSVAHFMDVHPEAWERATSKNGNPIVKVSFDGKSYGFPKNKIGSIRPSWWSEEAEAAC